MKDRHVSHSASASGGFPGLCVITNGVLSMVFVLDWYCRLLVCVIEEALVIAESIQFISHFLSSWHLFSNVLLLEQTRLIWRHWL